MKTATRILTGCAASAVIAWAIAPALADPLPGRDVLKFQQKPLNGLNVFIPSTGGGTGALLTFWGHDELSTAGLDPGVGEYFGDFMADDFSDTNPNPVVHVKWWGSYIDGFGEPNAATGGAGVQKFLISFESDTPAEPGVTPWSRPGAPLLNQVVQRGPLTPASGTFTERAISTPPFGGETLYEYNAELQCEFPQKPDTVYWLKIVALDDLDAGQNPTLQWGWHNRDYTVKDPLASPAVTPGERIVGALPDDVGTPIWHHQDDAVQGFVNLSRNPKATSPCDEWLVHQDAFAPTHYLDGIDGPGPSTLGGNFPGIGAFSKDLAFELYTVPEPSTLVLAAMGLLGLVGLLRRRRMALPSG